MLLSLVWEALIPWFKGPQEMVLCQPHVGLVIYVISLYLIMKTKLLVNIKYNYSIFVFSNEKLKPIVVFLKGGILVKSMLGLVDSTLGLMDSILGLVHSTLGLMDSTLGLMDIPLGLVDNTLGLVNCILSLVGSTLGLLDSTLD